jgi:hypothetical protein
MPHPDAGRKLVAEVTRRARRRQRVDEARPEECHTKARDFGRVSGKANGRRILRLRQQAERAVRGTRCGLSFSLFSPSVARSVVSALSEW